MECCRSLVAYRCSVKNGDVATQDSNTVTVVLSKTIMKNIIFNEDRRAAQV